MKPIHTIFDSGALFAVISNKTQKNLYPLRKGKKKKEKKYI